MSSVEIEYRLFQLTNRRGRPPKVISEEERRARLQIKCEKQKEFNRLHPELYKERAEKTREKNREKINERARIKRAMLKALRADNERQPILA